MTPTELRRAFVAAERLAGELRRAVAAHESRPPPSADAVEERPSVTLDLAAPLASLRAASGLSQRELSARAGSSPTAVQMAEQSEDGLQIRTLMRYAAAAGGRLDLRFSKNSS